LPIGHYKVCELCATILRQDMCSSLPMNTIMTPELLPSFLLSHLLLLMNSTIFNSQIVCHVSGIQYAPHFSAVACRASYYQVRSQFSVHRISFAVSCRASDYQVRGPCIVFLSR
jgi:hypothetical protein